MPKTKPAKETKPAEPSEEEVVTIVTPEVYIDHDDEGFTISVELPGVAKEHVNLSMGPQSLCVEAMRDDVVYQGCFTLAHVVDESKAKAKFADGLLKVEVPFKEPIKGKRIKIE
jgi:HSP20 family protein